MTLNPRILGVLASIATLLTGMTMARAADEASIEERLSNYRPGGLLTVPAQEAILTGDNDLILLQRRKFFTLEASVDYTHTSNAFLSDNRRDSDFVVDINASARAATQIASRYDLFAEATVGTARYADNTSLDYDNFGVQMGAAMPVGNYNVGVIYGMTMAFGPDGFSEHQVTLHDIALNVNRTYLVGANTALVPQLVLGRTFADPADYNVWSAKGRVSLIHRLQPGLTAQMGFDAGYRNYDNYFEASTGEDRQDYNYGLSAGLHWQFAPAGQLSGEVSAMNNRSTVDANNYHALNLTPRVRLSVKF